MEDGNRYSDWVDQMRLEKIDDLTYRSTHAAPGFGHRAYGGHFMAQALWAAAQTVKKGFFVHVRSYAVWLCWMVRSKNCALTWSRISLDTFSFREPRISRLSIGFVCLEKEAGIARGT